MLLTFQVPQQHTWFIESIFFFLFFFERSFFFLQGKEFFREGLFKKKFEITLEVKKKIFLFTFNVFRQR